MRPLCIFERISQQIFIFPCIIISADLDNMSKPQEILQYQCPMVVRGSRIAWAAGKDLVVYDMEKGSFEMSHGLT